MLTVFSDQDGVIYHESKSSKAPPWRSAKEERPELWKSGEWVLHHDNALAHSSQLIQIFPVKHSIAQLRQLPYSSELAPCDFWFFPKLKYPLKEERFEDVEEIKRNVTGQLLAIAITEYKECFRKWEYHWKKVVTSKGKYFEGDIVAIGYS